MWDAAAVAILYAVLNAYFFKVITFQLGPWILLSLHNDQFTVEETRLLQQSKVKNRL